MGEEIDVYHEPSGAGCHARGSCMLNEQLGTSTRHQSLNGSSSAASLTVSSMMLTIVEYGQRLPFQQLVQVAQAVGADVRRAGGFLPPLPAPGPLGGRHWAAAAATKTVYSFWDSVTTLK